MTSSVHLRVAAPDEIETIRDLAVAAGLGPSRARMTMTFESSTYWLALDGDAPVGCVGLEHGRGAGLLRSAAVVPSMQGRGIGALLAAEVLRASVSRGDRALFLFSSHAGAYWERLGFAPTSVWTLAAALPDVPQVRSGLSRGWLADDAAWVLRHGGSRGVGI